MSRRCHSRRICTATLDDSRPDDFPGRRGSRRSGGDDGGWISERPRSEKRLTGRGVAGGVPGRTGLPHRRLDSLLNGTFVEVVTALLAVRRRADNGPEPG